MIKLGRILNLRERHPGFNVGDLVIINTITDGVTAAIISSLSTEFETGDTQPMRSTTISTSDLSILTRNGQWSFNRDIINGYGGIEMFASNGNGNEMVLHSFVIRYNFNSDSPVRLADYEYFLRHNATVRKTEDTKEDKILSNNLKIYIPSSKYSTEELLKVFKFIPVRISNQYGWYDPIGKKCIVRERIVIQNKRKPWITKTNKITRFYKLSDISTTSSEADVIKFIEASLFKKCRYKVKDYVESGKIFKFTNEKKEALGKEFEALDITLGFESKNSTSPIDTIILKLPTGNRRFVLSDVEIIYPNVRGYSESKDRTIRAGVKVRVVNDKHTVFKRNEVVVPSLIKKIGSKSYAVFELKDTVKYYNINKFKTI